jgi:hypothetical protein
MKSQYDALRKELQTELEGMQEEITRRYADKFLQLFRFMLAGYDLRRHNIRISAGMGSANLNIHDRATGERKKAVYDVYADRGVAGVLWEIEYMLTGVEAWSYHLDGESLTP